MPYQQPSAYPPAPVVKKRPSWLWFVGGGLMMVAALVIAALTFIPLGLDIRRDDGVFPASGTHAVTVPAGAERAVFIRDGDPVPRCNVSDGSGTPLQFRSPDSRFTYNDWVAVWVFDTGDGSLRVHCARDQVGEVRIAQIPSDGDLARAVVLGFVVPLVVGGIGFLMVLVTGILFFTRRRRSGQPGPPPGAPPGWQPAPPQNWPPGGYQGQPQQPGQAWPPAPPTQPGQPGQSQQPGQPGPPEQPRGMPGWPPSS
jgi:hypothetical protein